MSLRAAFIDIGTNAVLCLIAELRDSGRFRVLDDLAALTRLGEALDRTRRIGPEGERRSAEVLARYLDRCRALGVQEIHAVGTSALREASNSDAVRAYFRERLGLEVRVLSGAEEAAYSFLAVQRGLDLREQDLLVIDIGGGSTELIWGGARGVQEAVSLDLGSVKLTERWLRSDPVSDTECERVIEIIDRALGALPAARVERGAGSRLVGVAGTLTTLAAIEKGLVRYAHSEVHGSRLTLREVQRQIRLLKSKTIEERKQIAGLEAARADVILAGAMLTERIMQHFAASELIVSDQGVRFGLLHERLGGALFC